MAELIEEKQIRLSLTKIVPEHRVTVYFTWLKSDFTIMDSRYRAIREKSRDPMFSCFWCKRKFKDGEIIALAGRLKGGNVVLCQCCAGVVKQES